MTPAVEKAVEIIRQMGGTIRTSEAIRKGVHPRELYALRDRGTELYSFWLCAFCQRDNSGSQG